MDLDLNLNLDPQSHPAEYSLLDRIRLLESIVARAQHHRRPPPLPPQETPTPDLPLPCKIDGGTHLLAKALAIDSSSEQIKSSTAIPPPSAIPRNPSGSVFDCNICYSLSSDPIVTCCGHIFCWPCFHALPNSDSCYSKECPVCQGEVLETDVTPIYGGASSAEPDLPVVVASSSSNDPIAVKIPPRPRARRIVGTARSRSGWAYTAISPHQRGALPRASELHPSLMMPNRPAEGISNADAHSETPDVRWRRGPYTVMPPHLRGALTRASELHPSLMPVSNPNRPAEGIGNAAAVGISNAATVNSIAEHPSWMPVSNPNRPAEGIGNAAAVGISNAATVNSVADAHSETQVTDRIATGVASYSSSRRARNESSEVGSTLRNQRRRGEWMS